MRLPPGQQAAKGFPRFGTHLHRSPPAVPANPTIEIAGAVIERKAIPLADLAKLPRREQASDFHCVAGWTATGLRWEGVPFADFYRAVVEPSLQEGAAVTHIGFAGLDGYRAVLLLEDALDGEVLIADRLDGRPLDSDHGAPVRLLSPKQYGFMSTKHLCRIEVHTSEPDESYGDLDLFGRAMLRTALLPHRRARVDREERHRHLPAWAVRYPYRALIPYIRALSARGSRER